MGTLDASRRRRGDFSVVRDQLVSNEWNRRWQGAGLVLVAQLTMVEFYPHFGDRVGLVRSSALQKLALSTAVIAEGLLDQLSIAIRPRNLDRAEVKNAKPILRLQGRAAQ